MAKNLDPLAVFNVAYRDRQARHPLRFLGNPYKLVDAKLALVSSLDTARAALAYERHPIKGGGWDLLGNCLAFERRSWTQKALSRTIPKVLGYDAVPGLEVMGNSRLSASFTGTVLKDILPAATTGLALPNGEPMMVCLVDVLERTLALIDATLAECEVAHVSLN